MRSVIVLSFFIFSFTILNAKWETVYSNEFNRSGDANGYTTVVTNPQWQNPPGIDSTPDTKNHYLGQFGKQKVTFILHQMPSHDSVLIKFDLLIINSWDGNKDSKNEDSPDKFIFLADSKRLVYTTFSLNNGQNQSYPADYPNGNYPPRTGLIFYSTYGIIKYGIAHIEKKIPHTDDSLPMSFEAQLIDKFPQMANESWGIDNVEISVYRQEHQLRVWFPDTVARIGSDVFEIPLKAVLIDSGLKSNVNFIAEIEFNKTVFLPVEFSGIADKNYISGDNRVIEVSGYNAHFDKKDTVVFKMKGKILMGNSRMNPVVIRNFRTTDELLGIEMINGKISIDACSFDLNQITLAKDVISFNKVVEDGILNFECFSENEIRPQISVSNINGITMLKTELHFNSSIRNHSLYLNGLEPGVYFLSAIGENIKQVDKFVLVK